jgi:hypothetical protein
MTLQEQFENAGSTVRYIVEENGKIEFLTTADTYEQFKILLEIVEVQVINENYNKISGATYSGDMYNGSIKI